MSNIAVQKDRMSVLSPSVTYFVEVRPPGSAEFTIWGDTQPQLTSIGTNIDGPLPPVGSEVRTTLLLPVPRGKINTELNIVQLSIQIARNTATISGTKLEGVKITALDTDGKALVFVAEETTYTTYKIYFELPPSGKIEIRPSSGSSVWATLNHEEHRIINFVEPPSVQSRIHGSKLRNSHITVLDTNGNILARDISDNISYTINFSLPLSGKIEVRSSVNDTSVNPSQWITLSAGNNRNVNFVAPSSVPVVNIPLVNIPVPIMQPIAPVKVSSKYTRITFFDNFQTLDATKWSHALPGPRWNAINVPTAVTVDNGSLTIDTVTQGDGKIHTGFIGTHVKFEQARGFWEARMKFKGASGGWSAFWIHTWNMKSGMPLGRARDLGMEIDVVEHRNNDASGSYIGDLSASAVHWDGYGPTQRSQSQMTWAVDDIKVNDTWHVWGCEWTRKGYSMYLDGRLWATYATPESISDAPQFILLSSEVRDKAWAGPMLPKYDRGMLRMEVDYVRVWGAVD